jgi:hypothetical protein
VTLNNKPKRGENKTKGKQLKKGGIIIGHDGNHMGRHRSWPSIKAFVAWRNKHLKLRINHLKDKLTPLEYYVT